MEILVTHVTEFMKWGERKQLTGYIFACYIRLTRSSPSLVGFAVQSLLVVSLCQLASTEEGNSWEYGCAWDQLKDLTQKFEQTRLRRLLMFLDIIFMLFTSPHCTPSNMCPDNIRRKAVWLSGLKYLQACGLALIDRSLGLSASDNNNNNSNKKNNTKKRNQILKKYFFKKLIISNKLSISFCVQSIKLTRFFIISNK